MMHAHAKRCCIPILVVALSGSASGADIRWAMPQDGRWSEAINWEPMVVPGSQDDVRVDVPGLCTVRVVLDALTVDQPYRIQTDLRLGVRIEGAGEFVIDPDLTINSGIEFGAQATNLGTLLLDQDAHFLYLWQELLTSQGDIRLLADSRAEIQSGTLENEGSIRIGGTSKVRFSHATMDQTPLAELLIEESGELELSSSSFVGGGLMVSDQGCLRLMAATP